MNTITRNILIAVPWIVMPCILLQTIHLEGTSILWYPKEILWMIGTGLFYPAIWVSITQLGFEVFSMAFWAFNVVWAAILSLAILRITK